MKRNFLWMLAAILLCGTMPVTTACKGGKPASEAKDSTATSDVEKMKEEIKALYGENKPITDGNYDKSLAVKCINGTFVGKKADGIIAYKGIPFVGKQPVGNLRWKAPVDVVPCDSVYEAYYHGKSPRQNESVTDAGSLYYQSEDCLYLNVWKADEANASNAGQQSDTKPDGNLVPLEPFDAYADGASKNIDILQDCNKDELNYFVYVFGGAEAYNQWGDDCKAKKLAQLTDEEKALVESFCKDIKGESYERTSRLFDQIVFIAPMFRLTENQTKAGGKVYNYFFTPESSLPIMRCGHAVEVAVVLNHPENTSFTGRAFDETFSKTVRRMWVQFAKTGNPSLSADQSPDGKAKEWPLYDLKDKKVMVLDEQNIHPEKESERKILDWERTYFLTKYYCI